MSKSDKQAKAQPVAEEVVDAATAEAMARGNEEIQAAIEARAPADGRASDDVEPVESSVTVINLQANPMKVLGLGSYGLAVFTERQLDADPRLYAKIKRGVDLGILKVEG